MDIKLKIASKEHQEIGWTLDYRQLIDIQQKLEEKGFYIGLEEIEAVLLTSANEEHLIKP